MLLKTLKLVGTTIFPIFLLYIFTNTFFEEIDKALWVKYNIALLAANAAAMLGMLKIEMAILELPEDYNDIKNTCFSILIPSCVVIPLLVVFCIEFELITALLAISLAFILGFLNLQLTVAIKKQILMRMILINLTRVFLIPVSFIWLLSKKVSFIEATIPILITAIIIILFNIIPSVRLLTVEKLLINIRKYKKYSLNVSLSSLFDYIAMIAVFSYFVNFFTSNEVAHYTFLERFIIAPLGLIFSSFSKIFFSDTQKLFKEKKLRKSILINGSTALFATFLLLIILNNLPNFEFLNLFQFILNDDWSMICIFLICLQGIMSMFSTLLVSLEQQKLIVIFSAASLSVKGFYLLTIYCLKLDTSVLSCLSVILVIDIAICILMYGTLYKKC